MDPTETGAGGTGGTPQVESPPRAAATPVASTGKSHNGMLIALIAVSCMALILLGSTITLALVGDFGGRGPGVERPGLQDMGQMRRQGVEQFRERREERLENLKERVQERRQDVSPEEGPADVPSEGTAPETRVVPGTLQPS